MLIAQPQCTVENYVGLKILVSNAALVNMLVICGELAIVSPLSALHVDIQRVDVKHGDIVR